MLLACFAFAMATTPEASPADAPPAVPIPLGLPQDAGCGSATPGGRARAHEAVIRSDRRRSAAWAWMGIGAATGIAAMALPGEGVALYVDAGLTGGSVLAFAVAGPVAAGGGTDIRGARRSLGQVPQEPILPIAGWLAYGGSLVTGVAAGGLPWLTPGEEASDIALPLASVALGVASVTAFQVDAALQAPHTAAELANGSVSARLLPVPGGVMLAGTF